MPPISNSQERIGWRCTGFITTIWALGVLGLLLLTLNVIIQSLSFPSTAKWLSGMRPGTRYIALVTLSLLVKLGCIALLRGLLNAPSSSRYTYIGSDHPRTWDIGYLPHIRMNIEATNHYQLSGFNADAEWALLTPNDGILHLGPHQQPYSISLFHQLRCLDILRRDIIGTLPQEETKLSRHCLNYMRQMVLCRTDLAVDPVLGRELEAEVRADTNQCVDWRHVYQELERNQQKNNLQGAAKYRV